MLRGRLVVGATVVLGAVALFLWFRRAAEPRLPFPFAELTSAWPGEPNYWRDDLRTLGDRAVPPLLAQLHRRTLGEFDLVQRLRGRLPPSLSKFVPDGGQAVYRRQMALWALGEIGPSASNATPSLIRFRDRTKASNQRAAAVIALAKIHPNDPTARSNFLALLVSADQTERFYAAQEFGAVPVTSAIDLTPLIKALGDADGEVRANAAFSLSRFGRWAKPAVPQLQALLSDTYRHVPFAAAVALAAIDAEYVPAGLAVITNAVDRKADLSEFLAPVFFRIAGTSALEAIPWLEATLANNKGRNRYGSDWTALALCQVSQSPPPEAINEVGRLHSLNLAAVHTLGTLGAAASDAVPRMIEFERITISPTARTALQAALARITNSTSIR